MASFAWFIPRLIEGSGGHRTMLEHARALETRGHRCHLYLEGSHSDPGRGARQIEELFGYRFERVSYGWEAVEPADAAVATIWYSAAIVRNLPFECARLYFVQDWEACFNPMGDAFLMAENSYLYGLTPITIGRWLTHELGSRFGVPAYYFDFGANLDIYRPLPAIEREKVVCFIYQPDKPRRCSRIGIEALGIVKHRMPDTRIVLYGSSPKDKGNIWYEHEHLGLLSLDECSALYNRSAVGLCLSSSNPSRIPFEMMAAGLPVVELWRENTLYDFPEAAMALSHQTPECIAESILRLLDAPDQRSAMGQAGAAFMRARPLALETEQFCNAAESVLAGRKPELGAVSRMYAAAPQTSHHYVGKLPASIRQRLISPPNAYVNSLPPTLRRVLGWGARKVRRMLNYG
ncbi:MAG: glycosyltransferase family 4 protein [Rhodocyclaceae bacterium]|nr:glycosyltransferase family 4 protein [Rhodocyclaceae bacterium]